MDKRRGLSMKKADDSRNKPSVLVEKYGSERKAEFLLPNAVNKVDYRKARETVRKLGLDPNKVLHRRPGR